MANQEHLLIAKQGVKEWNLWRHNNPAVCPDLRGADFTTDSCNFHEFRGANLRNTKLNGAEIWSANLTDADLSNIDLSDADLYFADLTKTNLCGAHLTDSRLRFVDLAGADLSGAVMARTFIQGTDLSQTSGLDQIKHLAHTALDIDTLEYTAAGLSEDRSHLREIEEFYRASGVPEHVIEYYRIRIGSPIEFYSAFISYSHADKPFALALHRSLKERGIRCWLDEKQLLPGDSIYDQVDRGIRLWDKFLLCCSEHSLKPASWVDKEIITVLEKEDELTRQRGFRVYALIPLNLDGYIFTDHWQSGYRAEIRRRLAANFAGWKTDRRKFENEIENVIRALRADGEVREKPPMPRI
jgi:uncharacterized protein YjbI with pentapeptide repeats